jgi:predicted RecB family nuclease
MQRLVTDCIFASSLDCTYKCFLQLNGHHGTKSEYEEHAEHFDSMYRISALASIQAHYSGAEILHVANLTPPPWTLGKQFVVVERVEVDGLRADTIVLAQDRKTSGCFEPLFFHRYEEVSLREKLLLAYSALVVGKATGTVPTHGQIIYGEHCNVIKVILSTFIAKVEQMIHDIEKLGAQKEQPLFLCPHCDACEFRTKCHSRAVEEDNMSLLGGMHRGHIEQQNKKGIFTLHQFSHTFRPRRTPKRARNPAKPRHFALQALALRENKVYIHGTPELPSAEPAIYVDIEGLPGSRFFYLIGMLVVSDNNATYQFFWADNKSQQESVFIQFCESVAGFRGAALFHYGNYEAKALREMRDHMGVSIDHLWME